MTIQTTQLSADLTSAVIYRIRSLAKSKSSLNSIKINKNTTASVTVEDLAVIAQKNTHNGQYTGLNANVVNNISNNGNTLVVVKNTGNNEAVVTFNPEKAAWAEAVPAGETRAYGPFNPDTFNNDGSNHLSYVASSPVETATFTFND